MSLSVGDGGTILRAGVLMLALAVARHSAAAQNTRPSPAPKTASKRDSLYALNTAKNALSQHHTLFREYSDPPPPRPRFGPPPKPWILATTFECEKSVWPYCFGPLNGKIPFGAPINAHSVEFRTSEAEVPRMLRKTVNRLVVRLMKSLDDAQKKIPGDRWIVGQRVFHLVQHGEIERAQNIARECRSDKWWCTALLGYTSYLLNQTDRSDSAFVVALELLPQEVRCRWESIGDLVHDDPGRSWYTQLSCDEQKAVNRTLWWLSDPLYLTVGNERRAAHYYRVVFWQLFSDSIEELPPLAYEYTPLMSLYPERRVWQQGALESLVRSLGVPAYLMIESSDANPGRPAADPQFLLQYLQPTYHFIPKLSVVQSPLTAVDESWSLTYEDATERYHPFYGVFTSLDYQLAFFRRAGAARIIAAADMNATHLVDNSARQLRSFALVLTRNPDDIRILRDSIPGTLVTFDSPAPAESTLVGIEGTVSGVGAARIRFASGPPPMPSQRVTVSDILMVDRANSIPTSLDSAARFAIPGKAVLQNVPLGLFWEVYGLANGDTVSYSVSAVEGEHSVLTSIGRLFGVVGNAQGSSATWTEVMRADEPLAPRSVMLNISTLSRGEHAIRLDVAVPGQQTVHVTRQISVVSRQ